jgi:hypothetical protein
VKIARIWLLVLLAVLLPVRGAVAAGVLCPNESSPAHEQVMDDDHGMMGHHMESSKAHRHAEDGAHHDHGGTGHAAKCHLCAACCTGTAVASTSQAVFEPLETASETFSPPISPAMSFVSDGQERPPRTI